MFIELFFLLKTVGIIFSIGCLVILFIGKNASLKRDLLLPLFVVSGIQVVGTAYFSQGLIAALIATAFAVVVSQLFMRNLTFCDPCGRILNDYYGKIPEACPSCHTSISKTAVASASLQQSVYGFSEFLPLPQYIRTADEERITLAYKHDPQITC